MKLKNLYGKVVGLVGRQQPLHDVAPEELQQRELDRHHPAQEVPETLGKKNVARIAFK